MIRPQAVSRTKTGLSGAALLDRIDKKFDPFAAGADRVVLDMKVNPGHRCMQVHARHVLFGLPRSLA
jgi:hypothetical protein